MKRDRSRDSHALMSLYEKLYTEHHGRKPIFNRYSAKWGMMDVIDSIGTDRARELLDYYFTVPANHSLEFFYKNFDKMHVNELNQRADRERRARIMEQTEARVREARD